MFIVGTGYTRDEIHSEVGGSKQSYLPTKNNMVVAACLKPELNPRAPDIVLVGMGSLIQKAGSLLAKQQAPIPVFLKRATNQWEYQGQFRASNSYTSPVECEPYLQGSGRTEVAMVVTLERIDHA